MQFVPQMFDEAPVAQARLESVQMSNREIKAALQHDDEFFIQFFLGDIVDRGIPPFHPKLLRLMTAWDVPRAAFAVPRDHAKTTLAKLAAVKYFLFSQYRFGVYLSNTAPIAISATNDIVGFLESENCRAVFGEIEWHVRKDGDGWYEFSIGGKYCILRALGAGKQVRGLNIDNKRPDFAIVDDLEDAENIATPELLLKLKRWFYGTFLKAMDAFHNKVIWLGNMTSDKSILATICKSDHWHSVLYGCLLDTGEPLWPQKWSVEKLRNDYAEYQEAGMADIWFAEMMNMPVSVSNPLIAAEHINYQPSVLPEDVKHAFITVDLAISDKSWAHKTVLAVHAWVEPDKEPGWWQVVYTHGQRGMDPVQLFNLIVEQSQYWNSRVTGIESVAFQASLQTIYPHLAMLAGLNDLIFKPLIAQGRKVQRIAPWAAMLKSKDWALTEGDFEVTQELLHFDATKKDNADDHLDACAYGPQMIQNYSHLILSDTLPSSLKGKSESLYEIAAI